MWPAEQGDVLCGVKPSHGCRVGGGEAGRSAGLEQMITFSQGNLPLWPTSDGTKSGRVTGTQMLCVQGWGNRKGAGQPERAGQPEMGGVGPRRADGRWGHVCLSSPSSISTWGDTCPGGRGCVGLTLPVTTWAS